MYSDISWLPRCRPAPSPCSPRRCLSILLRNNDALLVVQHRSRRLQKLVLPYPASLQRKARHIGRAPKGRHIFGSVWVQILPQLCRLFCELGKLPLGAPEILDQVLVGVSQPEHVCVGRIDIPGKRPVNTLGVGNVVGFWWEPFTVGSKQKGSHLPVYFALRIVGAGEEAEVPLQIVYNGRGIIVGQVFGSRESVVQDGDFQARVSKEAVCCGRPLSGRACLFDAEISLVQVSMLSRVNPLLLIAIER